MPELDCGARDCRGVGVDGDGASISHGQLLAEQRGLSSMASRQRTGYLGSYRNVMGMAYLALLAI